MDEYNILPTWCVIPAESELSESIFVDNEKLRLARPDLKLGCSQCLKETDIKRVTLSRPDRHDWFCNEDCLFAYLVDKSDEELERINAKER